jgi:sirohydrochlorin ferrochelatase
MQPDGVLFCGHGSRRGSATDGFRTLVEAAARQLPEYAVTHGFLELAAPAIPDALETLRAGGIRRIVVVPCMLAGGAHMRRDIPALIETFGRRHPEIAVTDTPMIGAHPALHDAACAHIRDALDIAGFGEPGPGAALIVVGRGTADADANEAVGATAQALRDALGFEASASAFVRAGPAVEDRISRAAQTGLRRVAILPWLLSDGALAARTRMSVAGRVRRHPALRVALAAPVGLSPRLPDILASQARAAATVPAGTASKASPAAARGA